MAAAAKAEENESDWPEVLLCGRRELSLSSGGALERRVRAAGGRLPPAIGALGAALRSLEVRGGGCASLREPGPVLALLSGLQTLALPDCGLGPAGLAGAGRLFPATLRTLDLSGNALEELPPELGGEGQEGGPSAPHQGRAGSPLLPELRLLNLRRNCLCRLGPGLSRSAPALQELLLGSNCLRALPGGLLPSTDDNPRSPPFPLLGTLEATANELEELGPEIALLASLKVMPSFPCVIEIPFFVLSRASEGVGICRRTSPDPLNCGAGALFYDQLPFHQHFSAFC